MSRRIWLAVAIALSTTVIAVAGVLIWEILFSDPRPVRLHDVVDAISDIHGMAVDPLNPSILWVGSHQGLLRFTPASGWEIIGEVGRDTMGPLIGQQDPSVMYATFHPSLREALEGKPRISGLMVSRNRGQTWEHISLRGKVDPHIFAVSPSNPEIFYMSGIFLGWDERPELLYVSRDGGQTWEALEANLPRVLALAVHTNNPNTVLAGTEGGLFISRDGGKSWQTLSIDLVGVTIPTIIFDPQDAQVILAYALELDMGLLRSEDGGETWNPVGQYLGNDWMNYIAIHPTESARLFVSTQSLNIYLSIDGGKTLDTMMEAGRAILN